jgi:glycosyltransferase involved in cell wall biosynthesis
VPTLHLVIPFFNEAATLETSVDRVRQQTLPAGWERKIILVDDGSSETSAAIGRALALDHEDISLVRLDENCGKGAAVRLGLAAILERADEADAVAIQDADLEYDPADLSALIEVMERESADAAVGYRWAVLVTGFKARLHRLGNRLLTWLSNRRTGLRLKDMECCYKVLRVPIARAILPELTEARFGIEPQFAAALARHGAEVSQASVSYAPRGVAEGKKIGVRDGIEALRVIWQEPKPPREGAAPAMPKGWRLAVQVLGFLAGIAFLVWLVRDALQGDGWSQIREAATPGTLAGLLLCSLASLVINGAIFWSTLFPARREGFWRLQAVNGTASLLNYAPIRLGIVSRYVFHMRVDRMHFLFITSWIFAIAFVLLVVMGSASVAAFVHPKIDLLWLVYTILPLGVFVFVLPKILTRPAVLKFTKGSEQMLANRPWLSFSIVLRLLDLATWAGRLYFATLIIDTGLSGGDVMLLAVVAVLVSLNPLGRIGYREAAVRWVAPLLAGGAMTGDDVQQRFSQLALIESGSEALVVIPLGIVAAIWWVIRIRRGSAPTT